MSQPCCAAKPVLEVSCAAKPVLGMESAETELADHSKLHETVEEATRFEGCRSKSFEQESSRFVHDHSKPGEPSGFPSARTNLDSESLEIQRLSSGAWRAVKCLPVLEDV